MQSLLDPHGNYIKSEKNVKKFLKSISDEEIKSFYDNIELTPFPILLAKEYHSRFPKKKANSKNLKHKFKKSKSKTSISKNKKKKSKNIPFRHGKGIKISKLRGKINGV